MVKVGENIDIDMGEGEQPSLPNVTNLEEEGALLSDSELLDEEWEDGEVPEFMEEMEETLVAAMTEQGNNDMINVTEPKEAGPKVEEKKTARAGTRLVHKLLSPRKSKITKPAGKNGEGLGTTIWLWLILVIFGLDPVTYGKFAIVWWGLMYGTKGLFGLRAALSRFGCKGWQRWMMEMWREIRHAAIIVKTISHMECSNLLEYDFLQEAYGSQGFFSLHYEYEAGFKVGIQVDIMIFVIEYQGVLVTRIPFNAFET
ncbi:unnamed protein product [Eruca vesicaria subsp. sativa]|uniref:Uncharacterized protein n=1 Tax=Eruca vesicaria subsp. sativa TaxID=29727 RepID=A0ABC8K638_ERUVS|nr:unnamed protein product [Eruca vesicaria subsp. sativa]